MAKKAKQATSCQQDILQSISSSLDKSYEQVAADFVAIERSIVRERFSFLRREYDANGELKAAIRE